MNAKGASVDSGDSGEWEYVRLGEILRVEHGFAFKGEYFADSGLSILLTPKNFRPRGGLDVSPGRCKYYDGPIDEKFVLRSGDVVVAMTDLKQDAPILGAAGVVPDDRQYLHNQRIGKVVVEDPTRLEPAFVPWLLNSSTVRQEVRATATGATVRHTAPIRIQAAVAPLPVLATQRRIAATLGAFDHLIEINEGRIELLEDLARSLYREWFVRFRFPGHRASDGGSMPADWNVQSVRALADYLNGYAFKPSHWGTKGRPIIKIKELKQGVTASTPRYEGGEIPARFIVEPGDLLFSWSADLGIYLWADEQGLLNQHLFKVTPRTGTREFLFHALQGALPEFEARAQGTTMRHIKRSALDEVTVPVPPRRLMSEFTAHVAPIHEMVLTLRTTVGRLAAMRDLLLPRLVTGGLDISDVDLGDLLPPESE